MFNPVINPFSKYADKTEKKVDSLLNQTAIKSKAEILEQLLKLAQYNLVVVNLWLEKRFKGYKYLTKSKRKTFYQNTALIVAEFNDFAAKFNPDEKIILGMLSRHGYFPSTPEKKDRIRHLLAIMEFLKPGRHYTYLEGASFGKLLADISKEKMIGDCNQIVTFYAFLYSQKYNLSDLKIKLLPGHVCLHYDGIDIEATAGVFNKYEKYETILPIIELITTNLLDTCDYRDKQLQIDSRSFVKAAELAHRLSSHNEIVNQNLRTAYYNLAVESAHKHDYTAAKFFLDKIKDPALSKNIMENAVIYFTKINNFKKASYFASFTGNPELKKYIQNHEGWYYFNKKNFERALQIFKNIPDPKMVKACYAEMFNQVQKRISGITQLASHRAHKNDYKKMIELAGKMEDNELQSKLKKFLDSLG